MKQTLSAALLLSFVLAVPSPAVAKKHKKPTATPSTLPPTSPMLVVPKPDETPSDGTSPDKLISSEMNGRDLDFFTRAIVAGREQAFFVDLLRKSASSDQIKKLADALTTTQNEENMHIAKVAGQKGLTVSLEPTAKQKKAGEEMEKLSGSNFDKAAMDRVVAAASLAQAAYEEAAQSDDQQIKTFAVQMLPLAEEKRHLVEKMTGAGSKTANQLFRHGGASQGVPAEGDEPAATPEVTPAPKATPGRSGKVRPGKRTPSVKVTPAPADKGTPTPPAATPAVPETPWPKSSPAPKAVAGPTPIPAVLSLPVATPPGLGQSTPAPILPPIVLPKAPPPPRPAK